MVVYLLIIGLIGFGLAIILAIMFKDGLGEMVEYAFDIEIYLAQIIAGIAIFLLELISYK